MTPAMRVRTSLLDKTLVTEEVSVGVARKGIWDVLRAAGYSEDVIDNAGTVVTELASNAVRAAVEEPIRVRVTGARDGVWVEVWDDQDAEPVPRITIETLGDLDELACDELIGGWGLGIVESLSIAQEIHSTEPHGKWVGALIPGGPEGTTPR
ncbi:ATP-binding protein [Actinomadura oligospora]|uniref:ATP-binding protein n=1 Tax=Actinomadura oligospora TaxID=111804 RepID=UPI0004B2E827|nr:ATP-binding protein [Actinomadura oligospora]